MVKWATTFLDIIGLLLVAAGAGAATYPLFGWACVAVAGGVVLAGSQLAAYFNEPRDKE